MRLLSMLLATCSLWGTASLTYAYLGGFEQNDGYVDVFTNFGTGGWDVANYNAGKYGPNAGGGVYVLGNDPNGWSGLQGALAPTPGLNGGVTYATGHSGYDRTFVNSGGTQGKGSDQALVITTNGDGWNQGPREYSYRLDTYDLDGLTVAQTAGTTMSISFWTCANLVGPNDGGALPAGTIGDKISFYDSSGNLGFEVGYIMPGASAENIWYRAGNTGVGGLDTNIVNPSTSQYFKWDLNLNIGAKTVDINFNNASVATGVPLVNNAFADLAELRFLSTAGENNAKVWSVDDFDFEVCRTEATLDELLKGETLWSGDKEFSDFKYHGGGDMPAAEDIYVTAITDDAGNVGIRFQGPFIDDFGGGLSDALIDYTVTAPQGKLIKDVHMGANPLVIGQGDGLVSVTETFLYGNDQTILSVYDIKPGSRKLTDWADLVDENGELDPVQELHVQKDILLWTKDEGSYATMSFIDQTFSQCDADPTRPGQCAPDDGGMGLPEMEEFNGDVNLDGRVDGADFLIMQRGKSGLPYSAGHFAIWQANYGTNLDATFSAVPEPASWCLLLLTTALLAPRRFPG